VHDFLHNSASGLDVGLGVQGSFDHAPAVLDLRYGGTNFGGFEIFVRVRPSRSGRSRASAKAQTPALGQAASVTMTPEFAPSQPEAGVPVTLTVHLANRDGSPVSGAAVSAELSMANMSMGETRAMLSETSPGAYAGQMPFSMAGKWRVFITSKLRDGGFVIRDVAVTVKR